MHAYHRIVRDVLETGSRKENRTGVDTISTFGHYYELGFDSSVFGKKRLGDDRFLIDRPTPDDDAYAARPGMPMPLLTTKNISWKNIVVEMLWFLSGQTDIKILKQHGCKFWDAWADSSGKVPSAYGNFWRHFPVHSTRDSSDHRIDGDDCLGYNDQVGWVLKELRRNPMSRRMVVSAWSPANAQFSKLPPCHMQFILNVQNDPSPQYMHYGHNDGHTPVCGGRGEASGILPSGKGMRSGYIWCLECQKQLPHLQNPPSKEDPRSLCLHLTQRSCDVALGVPYNMASYALLLGIFSHLSGIKPGIFAHTLIDTHIYTAKPDGSMAEFDHVPGLKEQLTREPRPLPKLIISDKIKELSDIEALMNPNVSTEEVMSHFVLEGYDPCPAIPFKVAV